jgi:lipopolysaccharide cholinephosphotransferase
MDEIKKAQQIELEIFGVFKTLCEENNLRYYAIGGTLIGAIRHKGFIPWDDDIDVGMPRSDYEKFLKICQNNSIPSEYYLSNHKTDPNWFFCLSQFVDKQSVVDVYVNEIPRRCHMWVDVFPIDGLPSGKIPRFFHVNYIMVLRFLIQLCHVKTQVGSFGKRPWYESLIISVFRHVKLSSFFNSEKLMSRLEYLLRKYPFENSLFSGNMLGRNRKKDVVPTRYFGESMNVPFENTLISVPANGDGYLKHIYGDYMKLPSKENQQSHKIKIISHRGL